MLEKNTYWNKNLLEKSILLENKPIGKKNNWKKKKPSEKK